MLMKTFGKTGLELSRLGFGCMRLPLTDPADPTSIDYELSTRMLHRAIEGGVNYVDTAWPYHGASRQEPGRSEPFVGQALRGGYREKVHLATKLPTWLIKSRADMDTFLDAQLKRLETSYLDFYLIHNINSLVWPGLRDLGMADFLDSIRKDGRARRVGFSFHDRLSVFEDALASYDWDFAQIQYNYLDIEHQAGQKGARMVQDRGMGLLIMEPLRGGSLTNHMPEGLRNRLAEVRPEWSLADWGFRWLWNQPPVGVVLSGMSTLEQVEENLKIAATPSPFGDKEEAALAEVRGFFRERLKINCTSCGYCLPCPEGVNIPKNFSFYNDYHLMDAAPVRARAKFYFAGQVAPHETFAHCVHCAQCEEKCPQGLPISRLMEEVAKILG